jgi:hypothetical protein
MNNIYFQVFQSLIEINIAFSLGGPLDFFLSLQQKTKCYRDKTS